MLDLLRVVPFIYAHGGLSSGFVVYIGGFIVVGMSVVICACLDGLIVGFFHLLSMLEATVSLGLILLIFGFLCWCFLDRC